MPDQNAPSSCSRGTREVEHVAAVEDLAKLPASS
jgi:hypothetical protein